MKKRKTHIKFVKLLLLSVMLLLGCKSNNNILSLKYDVSLPVLKDYSDTSCYHIVPLETTESSIISNIDKILIQDDIIFILDEKKYILIFDITGKFISKIDRHGRGEGEYIDIGDFTVYNNEIYVLDFRKRAILVFNINGNYIRSDKLNRYVGMSLSKINDDEYVFYNHSADKSTHNSELIVTNDKGEVLSSHLEREDNALFPITSNSYFSKVDDDIYFFPVNSSMLHKINANGEVDKVFDIGINDMMIKQTKDKGSELYSHIFGFKICNNNIFICSVLENGKPYDIIVNINDNKIRLANDVIFSGVYKNWLITTTRGGKNSKFKLAGEEVYNLTQDSNPALVFIDSERILFSE